MALPQSEDRGFPPPLSRGKYFKRDLAERSSFAPESPERFARSLDLPLFRFEEAFETRMGCLGGGALLLERGRQVKSGCHRPPPSPLGALSS